MSNIKLVLKMLEEGCSYFEAMTLLKEEAATVGREKNYQFMIYPEPLGNPSFHVKYKNEWEVVLELFSFKILESKFGKFKKGSYLPSKIMDNIYDALNKEKSIGILMWYYMLQTWNDNNPKHKINTASKIPII